MLPHTHPRDFHALALRTALGASGAGVLQRCGLMALVGLGEFAWASGVDCLGEPPVFQRRLGARRAAAALVVALAVFHLRFLHVAGCRSGLPGETPDGEAAAETRPW